MTEWNAKQFDTTERKLTHDLAKGQQINAASLLLDEFHKDPDAFKAMVKRSMAMPETSHGLNAMHLNVDKNGDVFVWNSNEKSGVYAGTAKELAPPPPPPEAPKPAAIVAQAGEPINLLPPTAPKAATDNGFAAPLAPAPDHPLYTGAVDAPHRPPAADCAPPHIFKGLNLGLIRIGAYDHHSVGAGVNIGIARADALIGQHTGVDAKVGISQLGACAAVGVDIDEKGLQPAAVARVNVADLVGGGADAAVTLGPTSFARGGVEVEALGAHARVSEDVTADDRGLSASHAADAGFLNWVGAHHEAHAELSADSKAYTSAGINVGPATIESGTGVDTHGDTVIAPNAYVDFGSGPDHTTIHADAQVGPSVDVRAGVGVTTTNEDHPDQWRNGELQGGIGVSGIGVKAVDSSRRSIKQSTFGVGDDY